jgi:hypothetical protein
MLPETFFLYIVVSAIILLSLTPWKSTSSTSMKFSLSSPIAICSNSSNVFYISPPMSTRGRSACGASPQLKGGLAGGIGLLGIEGLGTSSRN